MQYETNEGDTLLRVASLYTLDPNYAQAIARYNGFVEGTPVDVALEPGLTLTIPDNWLKTGTSIEVVGVGVPAMSRNQWYSLAAAALVLFLMLTRRNG